jgi:hypothetical protein
MSAHQDYIDIRDKLYGDIKLKLYDLVKKVFTEFQQELISEGFNSNSKDNLLATRCNNAGRKVRFSCPTNFTGWTSRNGCWVLARHFNKYIPISGEINKVDPSTLLTLVYWCPLFPRNQFSRLVYAVQHIRNHCYGHIPELQITEALLQNLPYPSDQTVDNIFETLDRLVEEIVNILNT